MIKTCRMKFNKFLESGSELFKEDKALEVFLKILQREDIPSLPVLKSIAALSRFYISQPQNTCSRLLENK